MTFEEELDKRYEVLEEIGHGGQARVVHAATGCARGTRSR